MKLYKELVKAYPKADKDLLMHYAKVQEMNPIQRMFYPLGKEIVDWTGLGGSKTGFSWDDIGADIAGAYFSPEQANERGLFSHTEGDEWEGIGQGMFTEVLRKLMNREPPKKTTINNSGVIEYPQFNKYKN